MFISKQLLIYIYTFLVTNTHTHIYKHMLYKQTQFTLLRILLAKGYKQQNDDDVELIDEFLSNILRYFTELLVCL